MARMTPEEAKSTNVIISYLAGRGEPLPAEVVHSLETLANRAHNRLQHGWDEAKVRQHWPDAYPRLVAAAPTDGGSGGGDTTTEAESR
ncbi:MAG TPA: hypothetical protein VGZ32_10845 [Actinocrinis sp.]|jgi:hypothetical protein|uniref:hypothetical protein n=1 Tax=Actinocrinis sp. TaxID=1920516 RepID=UPI002DDCE30F|nr:hypothetical protein [Actinocrinis sp.]HEV3170830.1 hypothetical protein [Actinocrinis sp.]